MKRIALLAALFVALVGQAGGALAQYPVRSIRERPDPATRTAAW